MFLYTYVHGISKISNPNEGAINILETCRRISMLKKSYSEHGKFILRQRIFFKKCSYICIYSYTRTL